MELLLKRDRLHASDTTGELFDVTNGVREFVCYVLEDVVRTGPKVYGRTAIPPGRYEIKVHRSPRFGRDLPLLMNVPNFAGILIHPGNDAGDTEGCLLPGLARQVAADQSQRVTQSRDAFARLQLRIQRAVSLAKPIWIQIVNGGP